MAWVIVLAVAALTALFAIIFRAGLLRLRESVRKSWANLDMLLVERHDCLPQFLEHCAPQMEHEQEALERASRMGAAVFRAASREDIPALGAADKALRDALARLCALVDNNPRLSTDPACARMRQNIAGVESAIDDCRESYNSAVNLLNVRAAAFPHRLVARAMGLRPAALLE